MSDDEYNRLLKQFPEKVYGALTWRTYFQRLVNAGRRTGRTDLEIGDDIQKEYKGEIPDVTVRKSLPDSFKHQEFTNRPKAIKIIASEPDIPVPAQPIVEIEPEPPKVIPTPNNRIKLDTGKYRSNLRIALINGDKVRLTYNSANEVIEITER